MYVAAGAFFMKNHHIFEKPPCESCTLPQALFWVEGEKHSFCFELHFGSTRGGSETDRLADKHRFLIPHRKDGVMPKLLRE